MLKEAEKGRGESTWSQEARQSRRQQAQPLLSGLWAPLCRL